MSDSATEKILAVMDEINAVPRQSHHLEKIHPWLMNWGKEHGFKVESDDALNILIKVPATSGYEKAPTIVLQGHMDMVCEKRPGVEHDFQNDPIISWRDGDWLRAKDTSLGADNAIALAMFFVLITDPEAEHPALEILITSDEETGLVGAQKLGADFLSGRILLNLDSEDEGVFTIGCAGGMDNNLTLPVDLAPLPPGFEVRKIEIGGLEGGHSGLEIHLGKANANLLLARVLRTILDAIPTARIGSLSGGTAHNAIPREAWALAAVPSNRLTELDGIVADLESTLKAENAIVEKKLFLSSTAGEAPPDGLFTAQNGEKLLDTLRMIPHGVRFMSAEIDGAVDTSMNFAVLRTEASAVKIQTNIRSTMMSRSGELSQVMRCLARLCGGTCQTGNHYPAWEPRTESSVLNRAKQVWKDVSGEEAVVEVTHAGLECGAIGASFPGMDMISFGPTIRQPHSPDERMSIPSVGRVYMFLRELLKSYGGAASGGR